MSVAEMAPPEVERDVGSDRIADGVVGREARLGAPINALAFLGDGRLAVATGEGALLIHEEPDRPDAPSVAIAVGFPLTHLCARGSEIVCGGQGGELIAVAPDGTTQALHDGGSRWLDALCVGPDGTVAAAFGRSLVLIGPDGSKVETADHPSTVSGLAFPPDGRRVAICHYDGVTIRHTADGSADLALAWKGSHIAVSWSPDGRYVVSATQERELHVWDLVPLKDFRLGGYPFKTRSIGWIAGSGALACSGADAVTVWPIAEHELGTGQPVEVGYAYDSAVTSVAPHPEKPWVAAGFSNGSLLLGGTSKGDARILRAGDGDEIAGLAWSPDGARLAAGTRGGSLVTVEVDPTLIVR